MNVSLDDYISREPTLQAAIVGAKFRAKFERRFHNSDEFGAESRHYVCTEMDLDEDQEDVKSTPVGGAITATNTANNNKGSSTIPPKKTLEEAYLALDLNEEDEFDKWYEQQTLKPPAKEVTPTIREYADSSNDNEKKNGYNSKNGQQSNLEAPTKIESLMKQPGFDLRQMVPRKDSDQPDFLPKYNGNKNGNNKRKQNRWGTFNNRFPRNNAPYQNRRYNNGYYGNANDNSSLINEANNCLHNGNGAQHWYNQNSFGTMTGHGNCGHGIISSCCSFPAVPAPVGLCQSFLYNRNAAIGNGMNLTGFGSGCNTFGCNGAGAFNTPMGLNAPHHHGGSCSCNNASKNVGRGTNIFDELLNAACYTGNSKPTTSQHDNINKNLNTSAAGPKTRQEEYNGNNGRTSKTGVGSDFINQRSTNRTDVNMEEHNDNNKIPEKTERKTVATMLGLTSKDLEIDSMPVVAAMIEQILRNGVIINLFPKKNNQNGFNSDHRAE